MMHPHTELKWISEEIGFGVVATKPILKGTITWVQDELDGVFSPDFAENIKPLTRELLEKYSFRNNKGEHILCWDIAKFVNHSFRSNCLSTAYNFEIAIRDIEVGEELTDDYGYLNLSESFVPKDEGTDRKVVHPNDILKCYQEWDRILNAVFPLIGKRNQPLYSLLDEDLKTEITEIIEGKKKMESTRSLYFKPETSQI
ncbi:SET domain-containing protein-lysine N-methyltransferase [Christiangramia fulva]|uniref:SET domain-containing protein-lysine N-methyltransferase n=1 Tax=Christiangramia fulva TaxID=2126553 RepID=A0A2R3Z2K8_9FLAO|nr:SET domain-containing protein [Christiangramia fulva]AVR44513.1 SET domain-containing protein-lysine N-methyltransferase [Christiangramia fulva]